MSDQEQKTHIVYVVDDLCMWRVLQGFPIDLEDLVSHLQTMLSILEMVAMLQHWSQTGAVDLGDGGQRNKYWKYNRTNILLLLHFRALKLATAPPFLIYWHHIYKQDQIGKI